jgi:hypothetical protein
MENAVLPSRGYDATEVTAICAAHGVPIGTSDLPRHACLLYVKMLTETEQSSILRQHVSLELPAAMHPKSSASKLFNLKMTTARFVETFENLQYTIRSISGDRSHTLIFTICQSSWLQIRRSRVLQNKLMGLEWGPLSLVSTTEELLGRNSSGSGLEIREYGRRDSSR